MHVAMSDISLRDGYVENLLFPARATLSHVVSICAGLWYGHKSSQPN